jgi:CheY-like chemotaxis protein
MAPDQLPHVFDIFYQAERGNRRGRHGLGIGLTLVRKIVALHGGSVSAHSDGPGQGSTFTVRLPLSGSEASVIAAANPRSNSASSVLGLNVLVVEDNQDSAEMLRALLEHGGARVHVASDGETAVVLAEKLHPDVILLDIGLPQMSGYDVAREIRRTPRGAHAFIVALTGWGNAEDRTRSKDAGFDHHLVKPVKPEVLLALIGELSRTASTRAEAAIRA